MRKVKCVAYLWMDNHFSLIYHKDGSNKEYEQKMNEKDGEMHKKNLKQGSILHMIHVATGYN